LIFISWTVTSCEARLYPLFSADRRPCPWRGERTRSRRGRGRIPSSSSEPRLRRCRSPHPLASPTARFPTPTDALRRPPPASKHIDTVITKTTRSCQTRKRAVHVHLPGVAATWHVQNSSRFLTTFDFDREYLRNGSTLRKLEKVVYQLQPLPRWMKTTGGIWSMNEKVIEPNVYRP